MFKPNALYYTDGYKVGHHKMLAPGTTRLSDTERGEGGFGSTGK